MTIFSYRRKVKLALTYLEDGAVESAKHVLREALAIQSDKAELHSITDDLAEKVTKAVTRRLAREKSIL